MPIFQILRLVQLPTSTFSFLSISPLRRRSASPSAASNAWHETDANRAGRAQTRPSEPRSLWLAHADDPWCVDLQSSLDFSAGPGAMIVRFDFADPIGTSDPWPLNPEAGALSQPLLLLHLAVHASGGLHSLTLLR